MNMVTLTLTREQVQVIGAALVEMPFRVAAPLIDELNRQLREQAPRPAAVPTEAAE